MRFLRFAAVTRDRLADHQRIEKRLDHEAAAQALEHDSDIETAAAKAAVGFIEQRADNAEFREAIPQLAR